MVAERPLMVSLLPAVLALLVLLVLLLSLRIWITSRMADTARALGVRARALAAARVPGPLPPVGPVARVPPAGAGGAYPFGPLASVMPRSPALTGGVSVTERKTWVMVQASPPEVETFIYVNGGSLLGRAPLRTAALMPGYHRLLFWAPSIRGRAARTIYVQPDTTTSVTAQVRPAERFWP
jgi:hypothetical protein